VWRRLDSKEPHDLFYSQNIIGTNKSRKMRWAGNVARIGVRRGSTRILVGRFEGKRPLGIRRSRWKDNIRMDLQEVELEDMDWIDLA
jgi:hypothetical protein